MSAEKDYLPLMRLHCGKIIEKVAGKTKADWGLDENLRDAVCMRLLALGDCTKEYFKNNPDVQERYPHILWDEIVRFRDKSAHHYEGIDYEIVWEIAETDILALHEVIEKELSQRQVPFGSPE